MEDGMDSNLMVPSLDVHYQPVVALESGRVIAAEALVRFHRPDGSLASPAEDGLIDRIETDPNALKVLMERLFLALASEVVPLFDRFSDFYVGVNVPPTILGSGVIFEIMKELSLLRYVNRFMVEVTERQALTDIGREALAAARELGIRIAVDDFGTGESGLRQIMGLEFDVLKIDRSLVSPLMVDVSAERLLRGVVALASALRVRVTAEGVETREQAFFLRAAGVDYGQGWYWSKALPVDDFAHALERGYPDKQLWV